MRHVRGLAKTAAAKFGLKPVARVVGAATAGVEPDYMGIGPIYAVRKLLERWKISMDDVDVFELNEAFAAQALAVRGNSACLTTVKK